MIAADTCFLEMINSPVRSLRARVELYSGSTLLSMFYYTDKLKSLSIERVAEEGKFFGFGVCQKLNVKILDPNREITITTDNTLEVVFGTECNYIYTCPLFYVSKVHRDENTNELSITAYDGLYKATSRQVEELTVEEPMSIAKYAVACANLLGFPLAIDAEDAAFQTEYSSGANFDGTESVREALNAIAEATQTIYYIDSQWRLTFRRMDKTGTPVYHISKEDYYTLDSGTNRRLAAICHATELGDNVEAALEVSGTTQYVRDNPFWDNREDVATLVDNALANIGGLTINQFECEWRGNFLLEIGDRISLTTKDDKIVYSYVLDDVITYDGALVEQTRWNYIDDMVESTTNPTSLGDVIKQTFARVDKANKDITLLASETTNNSASIATLQINTDSINQSVQTISKETADALSTINNDLAIITNKVETSVDAEAVRITVEQELAKGAASVKTTTGYTLDSNGLNISKSGSEMETTITEDGMIVYRDSTAMLVANNVGVDAVNLSASTYLIIGDNSRFENYGSDRTGCFWIGE